MARGLRAGSHVRRKRDDKHGTITGVHNPGTDGRRRLWNVAWSDGTVGQAHARTLVIVAGGVTDGRCGE